MKTKKRSSKEKLMIVLEGLKGTDLLGQLCSRHGITQSQYYIWRDKLLKEGEAIFNFSEVLTKNKNACARKTASSKALLESSLLNSKKQKKYYNHGKAQEISGGCWAKQRSAGKNPDYKGGSSGMGISTCLGLATISRRSFS